MSRRHNSSRRRNYGRRQHEVRERRPEQPLDLNLPGEQTDYDWPIGDAEEDRTQGGTGDAYGGLRR
jgi:hypothetical protein